MSGAILIAPGDYPGFSPKATEKLKKRLSSGAVASVAARVLESSIPTMRQAVLEALPRLEAALGDTAKVYAEAHEIRGLAGNAGLDAAAKLASLLCLYLDGMGRAGRKAEPAIIGLCVAAIGRSARALDEETRLGTHVVQDLGVLINRRLLEIAEPLRQ